MSITMSFDPNASEELAVYQHSGVSLTCVFYTLPGFKRIKCSRYRASVADHDKHETDRKHSTSDDDITPERNKKGKWMTDQDLE